MIGIRAPLRPVRSRTPVESRLHKAIFAQGTACQKAASSPRTGTNFGAEIYPPDWVSALALSWKAGCPMSTVMLLSTESAPAYFLAQLRR